MARVRARKLVLQEEHRSLSKALTSWLWRQQFAKEGSGSTQKLATKGGSGTN